MGNDAFRDQVVIVTGASAGIGKALALQLAGQGAKVAIAARRLERLEQVAAECGKFGGECWSCRIVMALEELDDRSGYGRDCVKCSHGLSADPSCGFGLVRRIAPMRVLYSVYRAFGSNSRGGFVVAGREPESTQGVGWMALRRNGGVGCARFGERQVMTATHPTYRSTGFLTLGANINLDCSHRYRWIHWRR